MARACRPVPAPQDAEGLEAEYAQFCREVLYGGDAGVSRANYAEWRARVVASERAAAVAEERERAARIMDALEPPSDQPRFHESANSGPETRLLARAWYVEGHDDATIEGAKRIRSRSRAGGGGEDG